MTWYKSLIFLHVLAAFTFVLAHGVSTVVSLRLPRERALDRIRALLELSDATRPTVHVSLVFVVGTGILLGIAGGWWRERWMWTSIILLVGVTIWMNRVGEKVYTPLKKAVGLPYRVGLQEHPPEDPKRPEEIAAVLREFRPHSLGLVGYSVFVVILAMTVLKPF